MGLFSYLCSDVRKDKAYTCLIYNTKQQDECNYKDRLTA